MEKEKRDGEGEKGQDRERSGQKGREGSVGRGKHVCYVLPY